MSRAIGYTLVILSCLFVAIKGDVSHLNQNNRYNGKRIYTIRLQRVETRPTPYPSAGYRPNREFNLPQERPLFPFGNQQDNNAGQQPSNSGFDNLSEPQPRPQLIYGAPLDETQSFAPANGNDGNNGFENSQGFNNLAEPQQFEFNGGQENNFNAGSTNNEAGFNNLPETQTQNEQQRPNLQQDFNNLEESQSPQPQQQPQPQPQFQQQPQPQFQQQPQPQFHQQPQPQPQFQPQSETQPQFQPQPQPQAQRPEYNYNSPARLKQLIIARLQQAQALAENQNQPQTLYATPRQQQQLQPQPQPQPQPQIQTQAETLAETQNQRLTVAKPASLTDNREERDEETAESALDIETTTKKEEDTPAQASTNNTAVTVNPTPTANGGVVTYYPATAFTYVQPFSAAYVAANHYQSIQPVSAAYTVGSAFLPQQYATFPQVPAQLQAW